MRELHPALSATTNDVPLSFSLYGELTSQGWLSLAVLQSCYLIVGFVANIAATEVVSVIIIVWDGADG